MMEPPVEEKTRKSQSNIVSMKKFLASKGAKSSMGQKAILHFLGAQGTNILASLQNAATRDVGEQKAKALIENVYVLACKSKVLYDAKLITPANTREFISPVNQLAIGIFMLLEGKKKHPAKKADVTPVALKFAQLEVSLLNLLKPLIKEKNQQKVSETIQYFGGSAFLDLFVNNPDYHEYKSSLHKNLKSLINERLEETDLMAPPRLCKTQGCGAEALDEDGKFAGSHYCGTHHEEQYKALLKAPDVHHFLVENGADYEPFVTIADKHFPPNSRHLYRGSHNYTEAGPKIRKIFAEGIYEKYLSPNATHPVKCLSAECLAEIQAKVRTGDISCYETSQKELKAIFTPIFKEHFLNTEAYKEYMATRKVEKA